jgi:hypothetical protein
MEVSLPSRAHLVTVFGSTRNIPATSPGVSSDSVVGIGLRILSFSPPITGHLTMTQSDYGIAISDKEVARSHFGKSAQDWGLRTPDIERYFMQRRGGV